MFFFDFPFLKSSYFAFNLDPFDEFRCILVFLNIFSKQNCIGMKKMKNAFFMFSGIRIDGHLTKKLELLRISCHLVVVNRHSSQSDLYLIALSSGRENHQKNQKSHFFDFFGFF